MPNFRLQLAHYPDDFVLMSFFRIPESRYLGQLRVTEEDCNLLLRSIVQTEVESITRHPDGVWRDDSVSTDEGG